MTKDKLKTRLDRARRCVSSAYANGLSTIECKSYEEDVRTLERQLRELIVRGENPQR